MAKRDEVHGPEPLYACLVCGMTRYQSGPCYCCRVFDSRYGSADDADIRARV